MTNLTPETTLEKHTHEGELWVPDELRGAQAVCQELYNALAASEKRLEAAEKAKRLMAGYISTTEAYSSMHPSMVLAMFEEEAALAPDDSGEQRHE